MTAELLPWLDEQCFADIRGVSFTRRDIILAQCGELAVSYVAAGIKAALATVPPYPQIGPLRTFLNAAAGASLVLDGVDAADLYVSLFPERHAQGEPVSG